MILKNYFSLFSERVRSILMQLHRLNEELTSQRDGKMKSLSFNRLFRQICIFFQIHLKTVTFSILTCFYLKIFSFYTQIKLLSYDKDYFTCFYKKIEIFW